MEVKIHTYNETAQRMMIQVMPNLLPPHIDQTDLNGEMVRLMVYDKVVDFGDEKLKQIYNRFFEEVVRDLN